VPNVGRQQIIFQLKENKHLSKIGAFEWLGMIVAFWVKI
jgi:hypothetical protein